jgi:hypothetical protein
MYLRYNFISIKDWPIENHNYEGFSLEIFWVYPIRYYSLLVSRFFKVFLCYLLTMFYLILTGFTSSIVSLIEMNFYSK